MRFLSALLIALSLLCPLSAHAERVVEVQGIHVEKSDGSGRDGAVLEATRQAASQAWSRLGTSTALPSLSPAQLQGLTSYLDIASESVQSNYYSGTFNIGIRMSALAQLGDGTRNHDENAVNSDSIHRQPSDMGTTSSQSAVVDAPRWILIIPTREVAGTLMLWKSNDPWAQTWNRAGSSSKISTATASGDDQDQRLISAESLESGDDAALSDVLSQIMRKYNAPAVAIVTLKSITDPPSVNQEITLEVSYMEKDQSGLLPEHSSLFVSQSLLPNIYTVAMSESQRLIFGLATGASTAAQPGLAGQQQTQYQSPAGRPGISSSFQTSYAGSPPPSPTSGTRLWVRIPLSTPSDLATYRQKINSISGARFEISAMNRMYVEGNIVYSGSQQQLMQELSTRGLRQQ